MENMYKEFLEKYNDADMVVVGLGNELKDIGDSDRKRFSRHFSSILDKKNYFLVSNINEKIDLSDFNQRRVVTPALFGEGNDEETNSEIEKQWDLYNKWLSGTLNKKLLIVEIGEGFLNPNVIRWPFEKINFINQKSYMYRISQKFPQIPENIKSRAACVEMNVFEFLDKLVTVT